MNRFEALHALGLEEGASDQDVKLSYYGLEKSFKIFDFSDVEMLQRRVDSFLDRARESKKYLLNPHNKSAARQVRSYTDERSSAKVTVTSIEDLTARLKGLEKLRVVVCGFLSAQQERRRNSIILLLGCVVFGFVALRYIRIMMARIAAFTILALVAVAGSTMLTQAIVVCRKVGVHVLSIDEVIRSVKVDLGLLPDEGDEDDGSEKTQSAPQHCEDDDEMEDQEDRR